MKKKLLAMLLTVAMVSALFVGCGDKPSEEPNDKPSQGETEKPGDDKPSDEPSDEPGDEVVDLAEITISFWSLASVPTEEAVALVEAEINKITEPEIGVTVNLNIMDVGSYIPGGAMATGVANNEDFDLVITAAALSGHYTAMMANGMLEPITDLLDEYAPDLLATLPKEYMVATTKDGEIYGVPSYSNKVKSFYWMCRKDALEAIDLDITTVKSLDDVEKALYAIKEKTDYVPLGGASQTIDLTYPGFNVGDRPNYDTLGETTAVAAAVMLNDSTLTAVSRYETKEFKDDVALLEKWYNDGLIDKDVATDLTTGIPLDKATTASSFYVGQGDVATSRAYAYDCEVVMIETGVISTGSMQQFVWAVPTSCDEPEAAVKFMNLVFTNADIVNLLDYGVEDVHYVWNEDGTIGFPEGITAENAEYYLGGLKNLVGNAFLSHPWAGSPADCNETGKAEMDAAEYSPLMGFSLDTSKVSDIYDQLCTIAKTEYNPALQSGSAPEGFYDEFITKMYAAGLQDYLDEINAQIQAWLAEQ